MPESVLPPDARDLIHLAPVVLLTLWGLVVLAVDFTLLRRVDSPRRARVLGLVTLLGVLGALIGSALPELSGVAGGAATREPSLFLGTVSGGPLAVRMNALVVVLLGLVVALSASWTFTEHWGEYYALTLWSAVGMMLLIASEELLTLFLALEMMTICLYLLAAFEKDRRRSPEAGLKYFIYGSVSSALFLFGLSLLYGLTGTTRLDGIGRALLARGPASGLAGDLAGAMAVLLVVAGFGFKVAAVPFHQWAPDVYEGAPAPVSAWIATGSKLASVIALMKVLVQSLGPWASRPDRLSSPGWVGLIAVIAAATMTYGNFAALAQRNLKRMLAYSSIAHAGYLLVGVLAAVVSVDPSRAAGAVLFYLVVYSFTNLGAFAVAAWLFRDGGTENIEDLDGLGSRSPLLAVCVVLLMLSLIGLPPLAGFFGKLFMFMQALNAAPQHRLTFLWLVMLGLMNSVISAFYYARVLRALFLRPVRDESGRKATPAIAATIAVGALVAVGFGLYARPLSSESIAIARSKMFTIGGSDPAPPLAGPTPNRSTR